MSDSARAVKRLTFDEKLGTQYCVPLWLRDEQIKLSIERTPHRIAPHHALRDEPIAVVCYGPSLADTWESLRWFRYVMTCSGAHRFCVERGIIPTWHVEVDPRPHKVQLIGPPHHDVEYLIASTCHQAVWDWLEGFNAKLWHVFDSEADAVRTLPPGEWALLGGCSVGLRTLTIARFFGFRDIFVFGMDGSEGATGKHAAAHPNQPPSHALVEYPVGSGIDWRTTTGYFEAAKQTFHELNQMPDVTAHFQGEGLVQAMARDYVPKPVGKGKAIIGVQKPELISASYRDLNVQLHRANLGYGVGGGRYAPVVQKILAGIKRDDGRLPSVLDYGCGKGYLAKALPFPIWEYDPAIEGKDQSPRPADLVVCTDVLEHIEPERLPYVLDDLRRCVQQVGYFVIHTGPASKTLPDGRNTHLIQRNAAWWTKALSGFFTIARVEPQPPLVHVIVGPTNKKRAHNLILETAA